MWEQFDARVSSVLTAKRETNELIGDWYSERTFHAITGSATRLSEVVRPESVDYIYTDPPYGGHIAYLDLSTMWNAWLGFAPTQAEREDEVIEGGDVGHTGEDYTRLLQESIGEMFKVLKPGRWLSLVFCHRDLNYWYTIRDGAEEAGFRHINTVVQPLDVVWSMHRKKNPVKVLAGELVINFLKPRARVRRRPRRPRASAVDLLRTIKLSAELTISEKGGASTEEISYALIPRLLECSLASEATDNGLDLVSLLRSQGFCFSAEAGRWQLPPGHVFDADVPVRLRARAYVRQFLGRAKAQGQFADLESVVSYVSGHLGPSAQVSKDVVVRELREVGRSVNGGLWELREAAQQLAFF
ncbi:MAG: hypothetical protein FJ290_31755 [Planctomycetes bacterium]|nr:hypothetical protein [Planctomycetota bacterium]